MLDVLLHTSGDAASTGLPDIIGYIIIGLAIIWFVSNWVSVRYDRHIIRTWTGRECPGEHGRSRAEWLNYCPECGIETVEVERESVMKKIRARLGGGSR